MLSSSCSWYTEARSLAYYLVWTQDGICLDKLVDSVAPLCNAITLNFLSSDELTMEACALDALERVFEILQAKKVPCFRKRFTAYLNTAIRQVLVQSALTYRCQEFDNPVEEGPPHGRIQTQEDIVYLIHRDQVQRNAVDEALSRFRFRGDEFAICCHGLDWVREGTGVAPGFLARRYQIPESRVRWLFDYSKVVYRIAIREATHPIVS